MKQNRLAKKLVRFPKENVGLKSVFLRISETYSMYFVSILLIRIAKRIQKRQSVPHESYLAWFGIRIATRAAKSEQRIDGKWEDI